MTLSPAIAASLQIASKQWREKRLREGSTPRTGLLDLVLATHPGYLAGWFHRRLCAALERFSQDCAAGKSPRLMIFAPPRHGKSEIVSRRLPVFHLGHNPDHEVLIASYGQDLADGHSRAARTMARDPDVVARLPGLGHSTPSGAPELMSRDNEWEVQAPDGRRGRCKAVGVGGPVTGRGANMLIIDDPVKSAAEARSPTMRETTWSWYRQDAYTRLAPGGGVLLMMTRWHDDDLAGRILAHQKEDGEEWEILHFPAIAEEDEPDRRAGEALHEERYPLAALQKIRAVLGEYGFASLYQQRPQPATGGMIRREWFANRYTSPPDVMAQGCQEIAISVDSAKKGGASNDYHAIHVWGRKDARRTLLGRRAGRWEYPTFEQALDGEIAHWSGFCRSCRIPFIVLVEDTANGATYIQLHRSRIQNLIPFSPNETPGKDKGKEARAVYLQHPAEAGQVDLPDATQAPWVEDLLDWWCAFPLGAHDDDVDAASQILMRWALEEATPSAVDALSWMADL